MCACRRGKIGEAKELENNKARSALSRTVADRDRKTEERKFDDTATWCGASQDFQMGIRLQLQFEARCPTSRS